MKDNNRNLIKLKQSIKIQAIPNQILQVMTSMDNLNCINIKLKDWTNYGLPQYCQYIDEWDGSKINAGYNQHSTIIKDITHISFQFLEIIYLNNNHISTIENLSRISMPLIKKILLNDNNICSVKSLRKCHWPNLWCLIINRKFNLGQSQASDMNFMSELLMPKTISQFNIGNRHIGNDLRSVFKIEVKTVYILDGVITFKEYHQRMRNLIQKRTKYQ